MKKFVFMLLVFAGIIMLSAGPAAQAREALSRGAAAAGPEKIFQAVNPQEAKILIETRRDLLLIDVRNPSELREGAISGSTLIPLMDIIRSKQAVPKDRPVLLICAVGGRSLALGKVMSQYGWPEIYNLQGGISAWKEAGLPVEY